jgi:hypothetical protein
MQCILIDTACGMLIQWLLLLRVARRCLMALLNPQQALPL